MDYRPEQAVSILCRTPRVVRELLAGLPSVWLHGNEGPGTWTPFQVLGHLVEAERELWIPRTRAILGGREQATFKPFDRSRHVEVHRDTPLGELLDQFEALRTQSLAALEALHLNPEQLERPALHPAFGAVTLGQLLATWVVHDLTHFRQIVRAMAKQYTTEVGPWAQYLSILADGGACEGT